MLSSESHLRPPGVEIDDGCGIDQQSRRSPQSASRVSEACQRCRRNKSRCDLFRPCALCQRANVECLPRTTIIEGQPYKRLKTRGFRPDSSAPHPNQLLPDVENQYSPHDDLGAAELQSQIATPGHSHASNGVLSLPSQDQNAPPPVDFERAATAMGITRKIFLLNGKRSLLDGATNAIPDGTVPIDIPFARQQRRRLDTATLLGCTLPPTSIMETLLEEYFISVHWFSLIIYEPTFRAQFRTIEDGFAFESQRDFLLLLVAVLGVAAWYRSQRGYLDPERPNEDWTFWKCSLLHYVESQLIDLMDSTSLASVQTCTLLGSYNVYHGRPKLSFALLGATIKAAQAIGLHREPVRVGFDEREERKRAWWTIYTWDRFASITYGKPLGINDKDCNVTMPADLSESPYFTNRSMETADPAIRFSVYQQQLNSLYLIASPVIEVIFGMRTAEPAQPVIGSTSFNMIHKATEALNEWRQGLPPELSLDFSDIAVAAPAKLRIYRLQSLSLQLTFDKIITMLHRPCFDQQKNLLGGPSPEDMQTNSASSDEYAARTRNPHATQSRDEPRPQAMNSTQQWWSAAVRTSRITELPNLAQLATDSHLVTFLAINLFNAAVIMVVFALSDPLSDKSQEAKRYITRIYRLLELLGRRSSLPIQSNAILREVIRMLLNREEGAMLATVAAGNDVGETEPQSASERVRDAQISVQDTLRLPLDTTHQFIEQRDDTGCQSQLYDGRNQATRLNEGLVSVQKAFPLHRSNDVPTASERWDDTCQQANDDSFARDGVDTAPEAPWGVGSSDENSATEMGLYWLWNFSDPATFSLQNLDYNPASISTP